jgi:guanine deaminase
MKDIDSKWMKQAMELAYHNAESGNGGPFGCIIVKGDAIIARGVNAVTTLGDPTAHAEVQAIREACKQLGSFQLEGCDIYTSCEPCPMCLGAIYWARPRAVYYGYTRDEAAAVGFDDSFIYDEITTPVEERRIPMIQVKNEDGRPDAEGPFALWSQMEGKIEY